jgi:dUTP pyrophosphatase
MTAVEEMTEIEGQEITKTSVKFKLAPGAVLPHYETEGSSGLDIRANEETIIEPGSWAMVGTGLFPEIEKGFEIQVRSRSGLAAKKGLFVLNSPGTVDSDYRGEIKVILANMGKDNFMIKKGDRIAQIVVCPVIQAQVSKVEEISDTQRGTGGFGSTGTK